MHGAPTATLAEARDAYLERAGLPPDGGRSERWVKLRLGPIPIVFPNTRSRRRAIPYHDIHHAVTGYATDWTGEAEVGAWELASGCWRYPAAWVLDSLAAFAGLFVAPRATWRAFLRGRHSRNLYGEELDEELLRQPVSAVRQHLGLDRPSPAVSWADRSSFAATVVLCFALALGPSALAVLAVVRLWG